MPLAGADCQRHGPAYRSGKSHSLRTSAELTWGWEDEGTSSPGHGSPILGQFAAVLLFITNAARRGLRIGLIGFLAVRVLYVAAKWQHWETFSSVFMGFCTPQCLELAIN